MSAARSSAPRPLDPAFTEGVQDLMDEMIEDFRAEVENGYRMTREEALAVLLQLQKDRARMRALTQRQGATVQ